MQTDFPIDSTFFILLFKIQIRFYGYKNNHITPWEHFYYLKVVSVTFLLVCFLCLKDSTCGTRKNVFYFILKALFVLEIIKFSIFRYSNIMTSSNAQA